MTMPLIEPGHLVAPATEPVGYLHTAAAVPDATVCGLPLLTEELWLPVTRRDGDLLCPDCQAGRKAAEPAGLFEGTGQ